MMAIFLSSITRALNKYLALDPESPERLRKLNNKIIRIELLPFHFIFYCRFTAESVSLQTDETLVADTHISGTPLQLLSVMINKDDRQRFFADDLVMTGDAELGQQVVELFDNVYIDWEEYASHFMGDAPAHHVGRFLRQANMWLQRAEESLSQNINEFIHEETLWLPAREALKDFFDDIDNLRMTADRLEIRINQLKAFHSGNDPQTTREVTS